MPLLSKRRFKITFKNVLITWGFIVSFIGLGLSLDAISMTGNWLFFIPAVVMMFLVVWHSTTILRRLNFYDHTKNRLDTDDLDAVE